MDQQLPSPSSTDNLPIDADRLWRQVMDLAEITEPSRPYTRRSFTPMFEKGRRWIKARFEEAGLMVGIDAAGNMIGHLAGMDPDSGTIMIGSHSDTVPNGGRFDGTAGVIAGLEVVLSLRERGIKLRHNLEIVDFLAEEPSDFGLSCVGSRGMAGKLVSSMLDYTGPGGERLSAAIARMGGAPEKLGKVLRKDMVAFFELHIEQGSVLERSSIDVGVVSGIAGVTRLEVIFEGSADHAGTTPMHLRRDASIAAAQTILFVNSLAQRIANQGRGHFVATSGVVEVAPNAANVVPRSARIIIDARAEERQAMDRFIVAVKREVAVIAEASAVRLECCNILSDSNPVACDPGLRAVLRHAARDLGLSTLDMASGAGHDAAFMASIAPAAMVFIPSVDGKSHRPDEWSEPSALAAGAATLFEAILLCDGPDAASYATAPVMRKTMER
jgi:N-carbamoyl-L-amino-acid hydrolase